MTRGIERPLAQRFILQTLMALFAEDIGLLEKYSLTRPSVVTSKPANGGHPKTGQ
jgi:hypothetical protein